MVEVTGTNLISKIRLKYWYSCARDCESDDR